jgi:hypothetical protein
LVKICVKYSSAKHLHDSDVSSNLILRKIKSCTAGDPDANLRFNRWLIYAVSSVERLRRNKWEIHIKVAKDLTYKTYVWQTRVVCKGIYQIVIHRAGEIIKRYRRYYKYNEVAIKCRA